MGVNRIGKVEARGDMGMRRPQGLLVDRQRPLVERLGLGVLVLDTVKLRQVVEARGYQGVLRPKRLLQDSERASVKRLGLAVAALGVIRSAPGC